MAASSWIEAENRYAEHVSTCPVCRVRGPERCEEERRLYAEAETAEMVARRRARVCGSE